MNYAQNYSSTDHEPSSPLTCHLRKGDAFPIVRDQATNYSVFESYFDLLGKTLTKYEIKDKAAQIYNCDETGMPLEHKMVIAAKGY